MVELTRPVVLGTVLGLASAAIAGWVAATVYRSGDSSSNAGRSDLVRPFLATVTVVTLCALLFVVGIHVLPSEAVAAMPLVALVLLFVPWTIFALRYAGRGHLVTRPRVAAAAVISVLLPAQFLLQVLEVLGTGENSVVALVSSTVLLFVLAVVFVAVGFVLIATHRHGGTPLASGILVLLPMGVLMLAGQTIGFIHRLPPALTVGLTFLALSASFPVAVRRHDVLDVRPGTGTIGERTVVDTMNEAFLVVGGRGDVVRSNQQAQHLFGADVEGAPLADLMDAEVADLRGAQTVENWTEQGRRRFDPRVSTLTDDRGHVLGHTVTLLDVTDREIRRQRLQVLNRILRHNIRNELSAIKARAELAVDDDGGTEEHVRKVLDLADELEGLSAEARRIESLMRDAAGRTGEVDLAAFVARIVEDVTTEHPDVEVAVDVPSVTVSVDRGLLRYALRNLVENAVEHGARQGPGRGSDDGPSVVVRGTGTDDGVTIVVADDGPGIPDAERAAIESGGEDPHAHASSLGLWGTSWAVQTLGGTLSFDPSDRGGAAVSIDLPAETDVSDTGGG